MSDYLTHLAERALGRAILARPVIAPFEWTGIAAEDTPSGTNAAASPTLSAAPPVNLATGNRPAAGKHQILAPHPPPLSGRAATAPPAAAPPGLHQGEGISPTSPAVNLPLEARAAAAPPPLHPVPATPGILPVAMPASAPLSALPSPETPADHLATRTEPEKSTHSSYDIPTIEAGPPTGERQLLMAERQWVEATTQGKAAPQPSSRIPGNLNSRENLPPADFRFDPPAPETVVHVNIGRVEIRAIQAPIPAPERPARRGTTVVTLEEYLKQRNEDKR